VPRPGTGSERDRAAAGQEAGGGRALWTGGAHLVIFVVMLADQHRPRPLRSDTHDVPVLIGPRLDPSDARAIMPS